MHLVKKAYTDRAADLENLAHPDHPAGCILATNFPFLNWCIMPGCTLEHQDYSHTWPTRTNGDKLVQRFLPDR